MRRTFAALSIVLACVLPTVAVVTWWAYAQATDTERFTATASSLATDDAVQREVVDELVRATVRRADAAPAFAAVPGGVAAAEPQVRQVAEALVRTEAYRAAWRRVQRTAHARLAARLSGDVTTPLTLDLAPVASALRARLERSATLRALAPAVAAPDPIVLLDRSEVRQAREATDTVRIVRGVTIPLAVLALLGVVLSAPRPATGVVRAGLCVGVATLLLVGVDALARSEIDSGSDTGDLRLAVYDVMTEPLHGWVVGGVIAAVALVIAGAAWAALTRPRGGVPHRAA